MQQIINNQIPISQQKPNYYTSRAKKIADFFIGFIGFYIVCCVVRYLIIAFFASEMAILRTISIIVFISFIVFTILAIIKFPKIGRRYIKRGIIFAIITPIIAGLIFFGACLILFSGYNN